MKEKKFSYKFVIRKDRINSEGTSPIYLRYSYSRKFKNIPLGESVLPKHFVDVNGTINSRCPNFEELILKMSNLENLLKDLLEDYYSENDTYPESDEIIDLLKEFKKKKIKINPKTEKKSETLDELFNRFIQFKKNSYIENSTIIIYNQFWMKWKDFEEKTQKYSLEDMKLDVFNEFENHLLNQELQINSIGKQMKTLKTFMGYISTITKIPDDFRRIEVHRENNDFIVLSEKEVELLSSQVLYSNLIKNTETVELNKRERLIGRIFLFLCSTGLSYVDFNKLTIDNVFIADNDEKQYEKIINIKITRQKVKNTTDCVIPIVDRTIDLIFLMLGFVYYGKDYDRTNPFYQSIDKIGMLEKSINHIKNDFPNLKEYRIFPKVPDQKFNKEIKEVLRKIGIDQVVKINTKVKNIVIEKYEQKYKLVSSHTGRRTYITWCKTNGVETSVIMKTTGHKNTQTLHRYTNTHDNFVYNEIEKKLNKKKKKLEKKRDEDFS